MVQFDEAWSLFTTDGARKYLLSDERDAFLEAARKLPPEQYLFCQTLAYTGCRLSEALGITLTKVDPYSGVIVIETLKQRRPAVFRQVPAPMALITSYYDLFGVDYPLRKLWPVHRQTAWRWIRKTMKTAGLTGPAATAKGLRHGFAVSAIQSGVPLNLVQKWLGHADISTTTIYTNVIGNEEREFAEKMWA